jgi:hypothetical protein
VQPQSGAPKFDPQTDCPGIDVRTGASTIQVMTPGAEASSANLRYQVIIARAARECALLGNSVSMKIGVQGRIILGPAGGPGTVDVPLRLALVSEGIAPKSLWTKLQRLSVSVAPGQTNVAFAHVDQDLVFPLPPNGDVSSYIVYVGFDPVPAKSPPRRKPKRRAR